MATSYLKITLKGGASDAEITDAASQAGGMLARIDRYAEKTVVYVAVEANTAALAAAPRGESVSEAEVFALP